MNREYYKLWYRLDGEDAYLIWFTDEKDGVITDSNGKISNFQNTENLVQYAEGQNLSVDVEDAILYNLDAIAEWLMNNESEEVDCSNFIAAWNLFDDISRSVGSNFDGDHKLTKKIYEKLFWGNNLLSMTPEGKQYHPIWTKRELRIMHDVLHSGLSMFRNRLD